MLAFEISLNGKKLCVAGIGDDGLLTANVNGFLKSGESDLSSLAVGGFVNSTDEHLRWIPVKQLRVNDEVKIRIVDVASPDEPLERYRKGKAEHPRDRHIGGIIGPY